VIVIMREVNLLDLMESRRDKMRISIKTPVEAIDANIWDELSIDRNDLNTEFEALPGQIAYWAAVSSRYEQAVEAIRRDYGDWYGPVYEQEFQKLERATGRRPNISSAEYMVRIRHKDEYNRRKANLEQAEADLRIVREMVPSLKAKLQALMQLSKMYQVEYNTAEVYSKGSGTPTFRSPQGPLPRRRAEADGVEETKDIFRRMREDKDIPF